MVGQLAIGGFVYRPMTMPVAPHGSSTMISGQFITPKTSFDMHMHFAADRLAPRGQSFAHFVAFTVAIFGGVPD